LLSLQQVGNVKYIGWNLQIVCSTEPQVIVTSLQSQIEEMESELELWEMNIQSVRSTFYELNYFTTAQLLVLRQALAKLKHDDIAVLDAEVLALLQSVHPKVDSQLVVNAIKDAMKKAVTPEPPESITECKKINNMVEIEDECIDQDNCQPLSGLTEEELSTSQKMIMSFVVEQIGCSKKLVLKAFEEHQHDEEKKDKYDYIDICTDLMNDNNISDSESEIASDDSASIMSYDDDISEDMQGAG